MNDSYYTVIILTSILLIIIIVSISKELIYVYCFKIHEEYYSEDSSDRRRIDTVENVGSIESNDSNNSNAIKTVYLTFNDDHSSSRPYHVQSV